MRPTDARRQEVAAAVAPMLADENSSIRTTAIRTIGVWGVKENIPALLELLEEKDVSLRWAAMAALGKIGDATAAKRLAESMLDSTDRLTAAQALTEIGPPAEDSVIGILDDRDDQVRYNACNVLGQIGSAKGVDALQKLAAKESNGFVKASATIALKKLSDKLEPNKK
jgi:HEAT repeat protein